jgi:hypothetical protein
MGGRKAVDRAKARASVGLIDMAAMAGVPAGSTPAQARATARHELQPQKKQSTNGWRGALLR